MKALTLNAPAKLNLTLDILRRRADGYHDLEMVMFSVDLCDRVAVRLREDGKILVRAPGTDLPAGEDNLAGKAARAFFNETGSTPGRTSRWKSASRRRPGWAAAAPTRRRCSGRCGR